MTEFEKLVFEMLQAENEGCTRSYWKDEKSLYEYNWREQKVKEYLRAKKEAEQNEQPDLFGGEA